MANLKPSSVLGRATGAGAKGYGLGAFDIDAFRSQLKIGVSTTNQFRVLFKAPKIFQIPEKKAKTLADGLKKVIPADVLNKVSSLPLSLADVLGYEMTMMCHGASVPTKTVSHVEYRDSGPIRKIPNGYSVDDLTLSFYARTSMPERYVFEMWINKMTGNFAQGDDNKTPYQMKFYNEIISTIVLEKWSPAGLPEYLYKFEEAYPISMSNIQLNWENQNEMVKFDVTFAYRDWHGVPVPLDAAKGAAENLLHKVGL